MSTKTGIPTSATFIFVNMLRKLRADFEPQYLAAVFDVAAPTFRDEQAKAIVSLRKFDSKTQTFIDTAYGGYRPIALRCRRTWRSRFPTSGALWRRIEFP